MQPFVTEAHVTANSATSPQDARLLSRICWTMIAAMALAVWISFAALHLRVDPMTNIPLVVGGLAYAAVTLFYSRIRDDRPIADMLVVIAQLFLALFLGLLLTYAASAVALPYRDVELHAIDLWLGFHRASYVGAIESVPGLPALLDIAYLSIQPQTALVPLALLLAHQLPRLQGFIVALGVSLAITALVAVFIPAVDAAIHIDLAPHGAAALPPEIYTHVRTLEALRSGAMTVVRLNDLEGLITFPSFHTTNALLFVWALWTIRYLRAPIIVLNALMIASTPTAGSHYFIDIVGGTAVTILAIIAANWCGRRASLARESSPAIQQPGYAEAQPQLAD
jgi:hypothetical protein